MTKISPASLCTICHHITSWQHNKQKTEQWFHPGIAVLNIAPEVPAMTMFRHIVFGAIIGILSKPILEAKK